MSERTLKGFENIKSSEDPFFDEIRPCRDEEAHDVLASIANDEALVNGIVRLRYPKAHKWFGPLLRWQVRSYIKSAISNIHSVKEFQLQVANAVSRMIATTTDGVKFVGFDTLDRSQGYLFISNHRDISLDPALIDYALHTYHAETVRIAIGDNLLRMPAATALMRLNKSFIVKRSVTSPRDRLKEINRLSLYIGLSLQENHSIWIAQREGRAKDGNDSTEEAVLKMLYMKGRMEGQSFKDYMTSLKIVPVSITYEYDPSDNDKAHELETKARNNGKYQKGELEDINSIMKGIRGYKGRVSIVAGKPIEDGFENPAELAAIIDNFIYQNYAIFPDVKLAAVKLGLADESLLKDVDPIFKTKFEERLTAIAPELHERVLKMYAYPYINQQRALRGEVTAASEAFTDDKNFATASSAAAIAEASAAEAAAAAETAAAASAADAAPTANKE